MICESFETKREAIEAAQYICSQFNCTTFVYWFPHAIPQRGSVVDIEGSAKYQGKTWAKLIFTGHKSTRQEVL